MALTRTELDVSRCETPGCDHSDDHILILTSKCHPKADVIVAYDRETGEMLVRCADCEEPICAIAVAEEQGSSTPYPKADEIRHKPGSGAWQDHIQGMVDTLLSFLSTLDEPTGMTVLAVAAGQYLFKISLSRVMYRDLMKTFGQEYRRVCHAFLKSWNEEYRRQGGEE